MAWHYVLNGESKGPVEDSALRSLREQNIVMPDTPVWTDGMAEWAPYQSSPVAASAAIAATADIKHACAECGKLFPEDEMLRYENSWVCAPCKPLFFQRLKEGVAPRGTLAYATVWKRFVAVFVDGIIVGIVVFLPIMLLAGFQGLARTNTSPLATALILIAEYLLPALYEIIFVGKFGATPGKMLMKIKVVSAQGGRISYGRSTGRYFAKMLSGIILYIGYFMAIWDEEKRALHDRICNTRVIFTDES